MHQWVQININDVRREMEAVEEIDNQNLILENEVNAIADDKSEEEEEEEVDDDDYYDEDAEEGNNELDGAKEDDDEEYDDRMLV